MLPTDRTSRPADSSGSSISSLTLDRPAGELRITDAESAGRSRGSAISSASAAAAAVSGEHSQTESSSEPAERIAGSRSLHAAVCRAVAGRFAAAGVAVLPPQAAFYLYPDLGCWREPLAARHV